MKKVVIISQDDYDSVMSAINSAKVRLADDNIEKTYFTSCVRNCLDTALEKLTAEDEKEIAG